MTRLDCKLVPSLFASLAIYLNEIKQNCYFNLRLLEWGRLRCRSRVLQTRNKYRPITVHFSGNRNLRFDFVRIFSFGTLNPVRKYSLFLRWNSLSTETEKQMLLMMMMMMMIMMIIQLFFICVFIRQPSGQ